MDESDTQVGNNGVDAQGSDVGETEEIVKTSSTDSDRSRRRSLRRSRSSGLISEEIIVEEQGEDESGDKGKKRLWTRAGVKKIFMEEYGHSSEDADRMVDEMEEEEATEKKSREKADEEASPEAEKRPTYIRVQIRHLLPETLDHYHLPWEYDPNDDRYLLIKENIPHKLQQELFEHTKELNEKRERRYDDEVSSAIYGQQVYREYRGHGRELPLYSSPKDGEGASLTLEIDLANHDLFATSNLKTRRTVDLVKDNSHLRTRLQLHTLPLSASVMTAHQFAIGDDACGVAIEYLDGPRHSPDSHFRWMHVQTPEDFGWHQLQYFISQSAELEKEEQALILALIKAESAASKHSDKLPPSKVKRAEIKGSGTETSPVKWAMLVTMRYLARTTIGRENRVSFAKWQYPFEPENALTHQRRIQSIRQMSPTHDVDVVRITAFLTFTGILVTFGSESFASLCQTPLSVTKVRSSNMVPVTRKLRLHAPNDETFHFPLELCATHFALMRAVLTACRENFSHDPNDYAVLDEHGKQIKAADWEHYCQHQQTGPWIDVRIQFLSTGSQHTKKTTKYIEDVKRSDPEHPLPGHSSKRPQSPSEPRAEIKTDKQNDMKSGRGKPLLITDGRNQSSDAPQDLIPYQTRPPDRAAARKNLPPNRISRSPVELTSNIITNLSTEKPEGDDLLFRRPEPRNGDADSTKSKDTEKSKQEDNLETSKPSSETVIPQLADVQVPPFFKWPTGDTEPVLEAGTEVVHQDDLEFVLIEVDKALTQGHIDDEGNSRSREHFAKLYAALNSLDDITQLISITSIGPDRSQAISKGDETRLDQSWQQLLHEVIRQWDTIMNSFCPQESEHDVVTKFKIARAAFFKNVCNLCEAQFSYALDAAQGDQVDAHATRETCYVFDCMKIRDDRILPAATAPDVILEDCDGCQPYARDWPKFSNRTVAISHLRHTHFTSKEMPTADLERYIVPAQHLNEVIACVETRRLMITMIEYLDEGVKLVHEIRNGVKGSPVSNFPYRLTKSMVKAFRHFLSGVVHAADVTSELTSSFESSKSESTREQWTLSKRADLQVSTSGTQLEFALSKAKNDLILQSHSKDYSTTVSYEVVDSPYVLVNLLASLAYRSSSPHFLNLIEAYKKCVYLVRFPMRHRPGKRLHNDIVLLRKEVGDLVLLTNIQQKTLRSLRQILMPNSFTVTTKRRRRQYKLEQAAISGIRDRLMRSTDELDDIESELRRLEEENIQAAGILQDDHGKAILVLTIVTVVFLPLSFVTSFLGMNTIDIRNSGSSQWVFWAFALPLTAFTMSIVVTVSYLGEQIRGVFADISRKVRPGWVPNPGGLRFVMDEISTSQRDHGRRFYDRDYEIPEPPPRRRADADGWFR